MGYAERLRAGTDDPFHPRTLDDPRQNGVYRDVGGSELLRQRLRKPDHAPLGGGIGGPERIAEPAGHGRHVNDDSAPRSLEQWHRPPRAQELARETDLEATTPGDRINL